MWGPAPHLGEPHSHRERTSLHGREWRRGWWGCCSPFPRPSDLGSQHQPALSHGRAPQRGLDGGGASGELAVNPVTSNTVRTLQRNREEEEAPAASGICTTGGGQRVSPEPQWHRSRRLWQQEKGLPAAPCSCGTRVTSQGSGTLVRKMRERVTGWRSTGCGQLHLGGGLRSGLGGSAQPSTTSQRGQTGLDQESAEALPKPCPPGLSPADVGRGQYD